MFQTPAALGKFVDDQGSGSTTTSSMTSTTAAITTDTRKYYWYSVIQADDWPKPNIVTL